MKRLVLIFCLFLASCSDSNNQEAEGVPPLPQAQSKKESDQQMPKEDKVWIYKYDGSLQCGMGDAILLEKMEQELEGIEIYSKEKRSDGLMRTQVCGSPTGRANVYEIKKTDLDKATEKGFQLWTYN